MSGPSEAAVRVVLERAENGALEDLVDGVRAAHDPANFEDPMDVSVRLGDVVEAVREEALAPVHRHAGTARTIESVADFLLRTFGGQS